jgi:large subunit ribosomal protein L4
MIDLPLYNKNGEKAGSVQVDEALFGARVRRRLIRDVVVWYEANRRVGTQATKTRSEVEGSTRKPWKQKHTGRARAGSVRSPIWRKGGVAGGPQPRDFRVRIPEQMRRRALDAALLSKFLDKEAAVVESLDFEKPQTKRLAALLRRMGLDRTCLIGVEGYRRETWLSARNLPGVSMAPVAEFNALDVLRNRALLLTRPALDRLVQERGAASARSAQAS